MNLVRWFNFAKFLLFSAIKGRKEIRTPKISLPDLKCCELFPDLPQYTFILPHENLYYNLVHLKNHKCIFSFRDFIDHINFYKGITLF